MTFQSVSGPFLTVLVLSCPFLTLHEPILICFFNFFFPKKNWGARAPRPPQLATCLTHRSPLLTTTQWEGAQMHPIGPLLLRHILIVRIQKCDQKSNLFHHMQHTALKWYITLIFRLIVSPIINLNA